MRNMMSKYPSTDNFVLRFFVVKTDSAVMNSGDIFAFLLLSKSSFESLHSISSLRNT